MSSGGATRRLGAPDREDLVRVAGPGLDEARFLRLAVELIHRAGQAVPVEQLVVAGLLDFGQRRLAPEGVVAFLQRLEVLLVGLDVGVEVAVARREEVMRPRRRGD
jgi:hypothetical protein